MDTLAAFKSRSDALTIFRALKQNRIACITVNTPSRLGLGCGISIVINRASAQRLSELVYRYKITSFAGFFNR
jgi:hypothetical protein